MSPASLEAFDTAARKGIQLDPHNAYFSMMRVVGLFAMHRDAEALEMLKAAGRCTCWSEYYQDEAEGLDRLQRAAYGDRGPIQRRVNANGIVFAEQGQIRCLSDLAIHLILPGERAGHAAEGIAVRQAIVRCGSLMRSRGAFWHTLTAGKSIVYTATRTAGGIEIPPQFMSTHTSAERQSERLKRYYSYLEQHGQTQEAAWARAEMAAGEQAQATMWQAEERVGAFGRPALALSICWLDNLALLVNGLVLLLLGAAAHLAGKWQPKGKLWRLRLVYTLAIVGGIWLWQWLSCEHDVYDYIWILHVFSASGYGQHGEGGAMYAQWTVFGVTLLTPLALIILISALSLRQRVPLATGLGRGLRGVAFPGAMMLFLLYGLSLLPTVRTEADLDRIVAASVRNQPQDMMERSHLTLPGAPQR